MRALLSGLIIVLTSYYTHAQKAPVKFGEISLEDLKMKTYVKDSSAAAVVLADYGESTLVYSNTSGFVLNFERITRIKILSKEGLEWANFSIPLYHEGSNDEKLSGLKGITYNLENGKIVESKLKNDAIFKEKQDANSDLVKITLPNVREGSIVEITYKVNSDFLFNFQDWQFQYTIPVAWSEYRAWIPEFFNYDKYSQGYIVFDVNEHKSVPTSITITSSERSGSRVSQTTFNNDKIDFQENRYRWAAKDVPAFKTEPFMTTYKDYISKINFELAYIKYPNQPIQQIMGSWQEINKRYAESADFGGEVTGNGFLKKIVEEVTAGKTTEEEKIAAIYNYVKSTIMWDGSTRKFITTTLKKVVEEKKGNSAEINLLMASMMEKAIINVSPVLISTRDHGFLRETIPVSSQFNNVICLVRFGGDKQLLLDATDKFLPIGLLPERCLNGSGLVINKAGHSWVKLNAPIKSKTVVSADFTLKPDGGLKGKLEFLRSGYDAQNYRKKYFTKGESDYVKELTANTWTLTKSEFQNTKELHESFKEAHEIEVEEHTTAAGDMIYLNPFLYAKQGENPFKLEKREYPVDFGYAFDKIYMIKILIPEGYVVEEMPKTKIFMLPNNASKYAYNAMQTGNTISITSSLQINNSMFTQEQYPALREFFNQVVAKQSEQIVLKKK